MTKALIIADRDGWSYMQIARALVRHNTDSDLHLDVMALKGHQKEFWKTEHSYDRVLLMGHQMLELLDDGWSPWFWYKIDSKRWLTGIHSAHAFDHKLRTTPDCDAPPPAGLIRMLKKFRGVNAVSQRLTNLFCNEGLNVTYTPNGVNTELFKPMQPISTDGLLRVGVAYTPKGIHTKRKGVDEFIRPACEKVGAILVEAKARSDQHVRPENMPAFMNSLDCYVCASSSEGFSIALLEAAACGRVVISTRVGGSTELIRDGDTGFLVDRTVDAIADRLAWIRDHRESASLMGKRMRTCVEQDWSWENRAPAWLSFLRGGGDG